MHFLGPSLSCTCRMYASIAPFLFTPALYVRTRRLFPSQYGEVARHSSTRGTSERSTRDSTRLGSFLRFLAARDRLKGEPPAPRTTPDRRDAKDTSARQLLDVWRSSTGAGDRRSNSPSHFPRRLDSPASHSVGRTTGASERLARGLRLTPRSASLAACASPRCRPPRDGQRGPDALVELVVAPGAYTGTAPLQGDSASDR